MESRVSDDAFSIAWFERKGKSKTFIRSALPHDVVEDVSVILWGFASNRKEDSFDIEPVYQLKILNLYEEHDAFIKD